MMNKNAMNELEFVGAAVQRVALLQFDNLLEDILALRLTIPNCKGQEMCSLPVSDKFYAYRKIWSFCLNNLYQYYLPNEKAFQFFGRVELTPYTLMLCRSKQTDFDKEGFSQRLAADFRVTVDNLESNIDYYLSQSDIDLSDIDKLPRNLRPKNIWDKLALYVRLINFPPLRSIARFVAIASLDLVDKLNAVHKTFMSDHTVTPPVGLPAPLHFSLRPFTPDFFGEHPLASLAEFECLRPFSEKLRTYKDQASSMKLQAEGFAICGHCGQEISDVEPPLYFKDYALVLHDGELASALGFEFMDYFEAQFRMVITKQFSDALLVQNSVSRPEGLILVEGQTEIEVLSVMALKMGISLYQTGIKLFNCEGKKNVMRYFQKFRKEYRDLPIVCLLDEDASLEYEEITRMIGSNKNKYEVFRLKKGTIEDIFPIASSIQALNQIYPGEDSNVINESDFDSNSDFIHNANRILWQKRQTKFDQKALFGRQAALLTSDEEMPPELKEVLDSVFSRVAASRPMRLKSNDM